LAAGSDAAAGAAADTEIMFMGKTSGERDRIEPRSALSQPHRLTSVPAALSLSRIVLDSQATGGRGRIGGLSAVPVNREVIGDLDRVFGHGMAPETTKPGTRAGLG
jgi:hypothetical protein